MTVKVGQHRFNYFTKILWLAFEVFKSVIDNPLIITNIFHPIVDCENDHTIVRMDPDYENVRNCGNDPMIVRMAP